MRYRARTVPLVVFALLVPGCSSAPPVTDDVTAEVFGPERSEWLGGLAWLADGRIVISMSDPGDEISADLWEAGPDGEEQIALLPLSGCNLTRWWRPYRLPDGRLGAVRECATIPPVPDDVVAIDDAGGVEILGTTPAIVSQLSWAPDMSRGLMGAGSVICQTVLWADRDGFAPLGVTVGNGENSYVIDQGEDTGSADCPGDPRADWPAISPDGQTIVFFVSTGSIGIGGQPRLDALWTLQVVDATGTEARTLLSAIDEPRSPQWSPDGTRLAFAADINGTSGTWLIDPTAEAPEVRRLYDHAFGWLDWSPDGSEIVGMRDEDPGELGSRTRLVILSGPGLALPSE